MYIEREVFFEKLKELVDTVRERLPEDVTIWDAYLSMGEFITLISIAFSMRQSELRNMLSVEEWAEVQMITRDYYKEPKKIAQFLVITDGTIVS